MQGTACASNATRTEGSHVPSNSFERGGQPRSVPDPHGEAYDRMIRQHRALMAKKEVHASAGPSQKRGLSTGTHNGEVDSAVAGLVHVLNGARAARHEFEQGHKTRGLIDGLTAAADILWGGMATHGVLKGHLKTKGPFEWRTKPWAPEPGMRQWMGEQGIVAKGQIAHHGIIPNNKWGKRVPGWIKHQPANLRPQPDDITHIRIHGNSRKTGLPRFNPIERHLHGTPHWWKAANAAMVGHFTQFAGDHAPGHSHRQTHAHKAQAHKP